MEGPVHSSLTLIFTLQGNQCFDNQLPLSGDKSYIPASIHYVLFGNILPVFNCCKGKSLGGAFNGQHWEYLTMKAATVQRGCLLLSSQKIFA